MTGSIRALPECLEPRWCALPHRQRPDANSPPHRPRELPLTCARRAPMPRGPPMAEVSATISPSGPIVGTGDQLKSASGPEASFSAMQRHVRSWRYTGSGPTTVKTTRLTHTGSRAPLHQMRCHGSKPAQPLAYIFYTSGLFFGCAKMPSCDGRLREGRQLALSLRGVRI